MKICAYCKTENRSEAIFCSNCRRPLPKTPSPPRVAYLWLLMVVGLIGLGSYLFTSPLSQASTPTPSESSATVRKPEVIPACIENSTNVRRGPGTQHETTGGLPTDACFTILGRNEEASWVFIISDEDVTGWVAASLLTDVSDLSRVSVRDDTSLVNLSRPTLTSAEVANGAQLYLTRVAATSHPDEPLGHYVDACFENTSRIGDRVSCRIEKAQCDFFPEVEGSPTVCIDRPAPDQTFALITFGNDWSEYDGQCIIVSGYLEVMRGMLQIQAHRRAEISPCNPSSP